jgi:hypothetical protein
MGRLMGIEPTNAGITIRCVNHFATTAIMVEGGRFELPNPKERIYSPPRLATSLPLHARKEYRIFSQWHLNNDGAGRNRTADTRIFSPLLYRLSYRAIPCISTVAFTLLVKKMAVRTGLEPATSCVTGRHSNQLNYRTIVIAGTGFEPATFGL